MQLTTFAQYFNHPMMRGRENGMGAGAMLFSLLFLILIVMGIIYLFRGHAHSHHHLRMHEQTPIDIAKKRYAAGEITKAEFEQIKKDLA
ncbi:MAG: hypothetical protein JWO47_416 [Candidatus Saccharibacteria bacterium]|nr:hypothetical protein [Candidatus Saccharibacteria bacterium]